MKRPWSLSSLALLFAACASAGKAPAPATGGVPPQGSFRYAVAVSNVPASASSLRLRVSLPSDSVRPQDGSALIGNAPLPILFEPGLLSGDDSYSRPMGPAKVTWSRKESDGRLELDIETQARPIELCLNLVPLPGKELDPEVLRQELDRGFTVLADGKPIEAGVSRLRRSTPVTTAPSSAPR